MAKRMAFFYLSSMVLSGFSNIIGWGMSQMNGVHGLEGWRCVASSSRTNLVAGIFEN